MCEIRKVKVDEWDDDDDDDWKWLEKLFLC